MAFPVQHGVSPMDAFLRGEWQLALDQWDAIFGADSDPEDVDVSLLTRSPVDERPGGVTGEASAPPDSSESGLVLRPSGTPSQVPSHPGNGDAGEGCFDDFGFKDHHTENLQASRLPVDGCPGGTRGEASEPPNSSESRLEPRPSMVPAQGSSRPGHEPANCLHEFLRAIRPDAFLEPSLPECSEARRTCLQFFT